MTLTDENGEVKERYPAIDGTYCSEECLHEFYVIPHFDCDGGLTCCSER